jgi:hypothetical protein
MIPGNREHVSFANDPKTLTRIGIIADHVAQTNDLIHLSLVNLLEHLGQRLDIRMNVRDDRVSHDAADFFVRRLKSALA